MLKKCFNFGNTSWFVVIDDVSYTAFVHAVQGDANLVEFGATSYARIFGESG
jgi:hypothetical protein